jgi:hypothetical protein
MKLFEEAIIVGALNVPLWFLCREVAKNLKVPESKVDFAATFLSGVAFHLLAERTGMNAWYVKHGHAAMKDRAFIKSYVDGKGKNALVCSSRDQRDGICSLALEQAQKRSSR